MGQIFISIHLPHDWNPPSLHRTIGWTPFLPLFTPCIIPWHSHFTHHPSFLHISHRHYHFHSSIPLCIHHHKEVNYIPNTQDTQSTAWLYGYSACSSLLDWMPLWTHTHTHHVPLPSLHEYTIPHHWMPLSRQTALTYSRIPFHNKRYPRLLTIMHIVCMQCSTSFQYTACTHSSTAFQYSRYLTLQTWLRTHTLLRTGHIHQHSRYSLQHTIPIHHCCTGLARFLNTACAQN